MFDPRRGDVPFELTRIGTNPVRSEAQRINSFTAFLVLEGTGRFHVDLSDYAFRAPTLLFTNPYQTFFLRRALPLQGIYLRFHANFFCIETHHEAVGCNGVLFNDIYGRPR